MNSHEVFIHIHQGCFASTGAIVRLPQCQWSKPDGYWKISQCITTTKHSKAKTVCIFLGIYCNTLYSIMFPNPISVVWIALCWCNYDDVYTSMFNSRGVNLAINWTLNIKISGSLDQTLGCLFYPSLDISKITVYESSYLGCIQLIALHLSQMYHIMNNFIIELPISNGDFTHHSRWYSYIYGITMVYCALKIGYKIFNINAKLIQHIANGIISLHCLVRFGSSMIGYYIYSERARCITCEFICLGCTRYNYYYYHYH